MKHFAQCLSKARAPAIAIAVALIPSATPAHAEWQSARTEGGIAAFSFGGKPAVPSLIAVCQKGTVFLYVNLAMDPEPGNRTIGFSEGMSTRSSEEKFIRDAASGGWVTQPSAATLALFNDDAFTLSVTLNGMSIAGIATQGYNDQGRDKEKGVNAALRPVFAACPGWRQQTSASLGPAALSPAANAPAGKPAKAKAAKRTRGAAPVAPKPATPAASRPPAPAPTGSPTAQTAPNFARIPLVVGYYAYVEGTFSTCAKPVITPWYFDGVRFWEESDVTDPSHQYTPEALKWEMVAADRFRISYRSRNERGQWDRFVSVNEYLITDPQSFTYVGTIGGPMNANERHQLCAAAQLPAKSRWFKEQK